MLPGFRFVQFLWVLLLISACLVFDDGRAEAEEALASWYGPGLEGLPTASGQSFDPNGYTAAHRTLPLGTRLMVSYGGHSVPVTINDRGPYVGARELDLSQAAARDLGLSRVGVDFVEWSYADDRGPNPSRRVAQEKALPQQEQDPPAANVGSRYADGDGYPAGYQGYPRIHSPARALEANGGAYVVQPGDTLARIAARLGTSVDDLARYNGIVDPDIIYSGQALYFPAFEQFPVGGGGTPVVDGAAAQGLPAISAFGNGGPQVPMGP